jgi:hypothetical protein
MTTVLYDKISTIPTKRKNTFGMSGLGNLGKYF